MTDLFAARSQMALSLAFHIIFAVVGMAMPLFMITAEALWMRTRDKVWLELARRWSKGTAILFAVGAVSGTALSFELGLLWPRFMAFAGPIFGLPFSLEGFAFFFEAIFLGVYLYGWERVKPAVHWLAGLGVWVSGMASGAFVVTANAWMNTPAGFTLDADGAVLSIDPIAAMFNPNAMSSVLHMLAASIASVSFLVLGVHAWLWRREPENRFHRAAVSLALVFACVGATLMPATGHLAGETIAHTQPAKLAAAEAHWHTEARAPFLIGGWPDEEAEVTHGAIAIPGMLSLLAHGDLDAPVTGLRDIPKADRPPVAVVHFAFDLMIACGMVMLAVAWSGAALWALRRRVPDDRRWLLAASASAPLGLIAVEAGWTVTEVGRQPWVVTGVLRTADAVTPMPGLWAPMLTFTFLYLALGVVTVALLLRQFRHSPLIPEEGAE